MRILILLSALCILLLVGYTNMGKDNIFDTHMLLNKIRDIISTRPQKEPDEEQKTTSTFETSKNIADTLLADAKSTLEKKDIEKPVSEGLLDETEEAENTEDVIQAEETNEAKGVALQLGNIDPPVFEAMNYKGADRSAESKSRQWELLEDAQRVLADVGELLK